MAFWAFWQPSANKLVIFIISCIYLYFCVENKFFFFFRVLTEPVPFRICLYP